jgi:hypothetical protein
MDFRIAGARTGNSLPALCSVAAVGHTSHLSEESDGRPTVVWGKLVGYNLFVSRSERRSAATPERRMPSDGIPFDGAPRRLESVVERAGRAIRKINMYHEE